MTAPSLMPIPRALLGSTAQVRVPAEGKYGGTYGDPQTIAGVRFVPAADMVRSGYVLTDGAKGMLFIDARSSDGAFELPVGALVSIDGAEELSVAKCSAFAGFGNQVHHWELELR